MNTSLSHRVVSTRALLTLFAVAIATALVLLVATTLGEQAAALVEPAELSAREWPTRELSPEWRGAKESVQYRHMFPQRPERHPVGSFDRVLEMAGQ